jgi:transmembrane sensor
MIRQEFNDLLRRYLNDQCTADERQLIDRLYDLIGNETPELDLSDDAILEERMWSAIATQTIDNQNIITEPELIYSRRPSKRYAWAAAAVLLLTAGSWWFFTQNLPKKQVEIAQMTDNWQEIVNTTTKPMMVKTDDNSNISLQPNSRLRLPKTFANASKREVILTGDAFFDIAKNPNAPFYVHANNLVTQVLGTSFWVKNTEGGKKVAVEVVSGKVSVFREHTAEKSKNTEGGKWSETTSRTPSGKEETAGVVLTPNLKVTYFDQEAHFITGIVAQPILLKKETPEKVVVNADEVSFQFNDTPLSKIIESLEKGYGIHIEMAQEALRDCPLTANLTKQSLFSKLNLICSALNARYEIKGTTILISGQGCE